MLPKNSRHVLYAILLMALSVVCTSAVANTRVFSFIAEVASVIETTVVSSHTEDTTTLATNKSTSKKLISENSVATAAMFMTIIQGADEELVCADDGSTVAKFSLCGDSDDRIISLAGSPFGSVQWEQVTGGCTPDMNTPCPSGSCNYSSVGSGQTFTIDASAITAATGAEFRVRVNGSGPWYYFEVAKSTITQTFVKTDFICGADGRIQITGLSSAYEYSIDGGFLWQGPIFDNLTPGFYNILARQQGTPGACEYPYAPIEIEQRDIVIEATFVDAQCSGDTGSVTVNVNNTVPGPYKYTLLDAGGVPQEFTAFLTADNYTFSAVGFGTYIVQVETQQCTGDPINGIDPPRQPLDTSGNPIVIGNGLVALDASTEVNSSFGCSTIASVDITLNASGGSAPYTYTVNGGPVQPSFTGSTTYTVTAAAGAGSYDFLITDSNGCTIQASSNVEDLAPPSVTASGVDGTCSNGGARINFNVTNANGYNLTYRVNAVDPWDTNPSISVPATPGGTTYTGISVRYQQGGFECTLDLPDITVTSVGVVIGSAIKSADRTCDGSGGTIGGQIDFGAASGGSGSGYIFSIDGLSFNATTSYPNLVPGTYTPMIEDGGGCRLELTPIIILDVDPPTDIDFIATNSNCAANTVDLQLVPTSNAAIVNYSIISPIVLNNVGSDSFISLDASQSYIFQITDANNCTYTEGYSPAIVSSIRARVKSGGDTQVCTGVSDGSGAFLIDGFANTYQYQINADPVVTGQTAGEVSLTGLGVGTYTITITDEDTGCTDTTFFDVEEATTPLGITPTVTDMTCQNGNIGRVRANATGGFGGYRYRLEWPTPPGIIQGPKTGRTFGNLTAEGTYTLYVIDAEGCEESTTFTLTSLGSPTISLVSTVYCYDPLNTPLPQFGSITVSSAGGGAGHEYRINSGSLQASPTFTGLVPGTYTVEVVDDNNCSAQLLPITIPPQIQIDLDLISEIPCGGDGEMEIDISGGDISNLASTSYTIFKDGVPVAGHIGAIIPSNPFNYTVPFGEHGDYTVEVTDNNSCNRISGPLTFAEPTNIAATHQITGPSCSDPNSGFVEIIPTVSSGIPPFEFVFAPALVPGVLVADPNNPNAGATTFTFSSQNVYSGLPAGFYEYVVKDSRDCVTAVTRIEVLDDPTPAPDATVTPIDATCSSGDLSGGVTINSITPGSPNYTIIIEDNFGNPFVTQNNVAPGDLPLAITHPTLIPGNYQVIILDSRGCRDIEPITINTINLDIIPIYPPPPVVCTPGGTTVCVEIINGSGDYQIRMVEDPAGPWLSLSDPTAVPPRHCFNNLLFGVSYTVEVQDVNTGCTYTEVITLPNGPNLTVGLTIDNVTCRNGDVGLNYNITTGIAPFDIVITNLDTGVVEYNVTNSSDATLVTPLNVPSGRYGISVIDNADCTGGAEAEAILNLPRVDIIENQNANCNAPGQLTVRGSGGTPYAIGSPYFYAYMPAGTPPTPGDFTDATTISLTGSLAPGTNYDIWVRDSRDCDFMTSAAVIQLDPALPTPTINVNNQCDVTATAATGFDITLIMPGNIDTPTFTLNGISQTPVYIPGTPTQAIFTVFNIGSYPVNIIDANGCFVDDIAEVFQVLSASGDFSTEPDCEDTNGIITISADGGSGNFTYTLSGTDFSGTPFGPILDPDNDGIFQNIPAGNYSVVVEDQIVSNGAGQCDVIVDNIIRTTPIQPVIIDTGESNVSCNGVGDGSINVSLQTDPDPTLNPNIQEYNLYSGTLPLPPSPIAIDTNISGSFLNLVPGTYVVEVVTDRNCTDLEEVTITEPAVFSISATAPDFVCEPGANRYSSTTITTTITSPGTVGTYRYSITGFGGYQTIPTFEIVDNGSIQNITVYAIDDNGCQAQFDVLPINPPGLVVPSITLIDALNCRDFERVRIDVAGTTDFIVSTISAIPVAPVDNNTGAGEQFVFIDLPASGDYLFEVEDKIGGCFYPMPVHTVVDPIQPIVVIAEAEPIGCFGASDGELTIEVTNYTGLYSYDVYSGSDPLKTTSLASGTNLDTANNPETITGLPGGNFFVEITSEGAPYCSNESNIATIRTPNGALAVTAVPIGNVSCNNNTGIIEATGVGGWDTSPYEYRLLQSADGGATYLNEIVAFSNSNQFTGLSFGFYQVEIRDVELCPSTFDIELVEVPQIDAGIREPLALQCPNGNNAILEAYDPTTGDAITATAGATGGFPGAGYTYRLLYLNDNDNTNIASTSGLQNTPTFIGASGGFISAGWYAIEVTSSFDCTFVTAPYEVDPPPPIEPRLAQTQVPGCGGNGQMRLSIENHDPLSNFEYEYRRIPTPDPINDPWIDFGVGVTELLLDRPGSPVGITYQYEVRKKNSANTCLPVNTAGITLTDAADITLLPNDITPISCAYEVDGRAESFTFGGVGNNQFYLYQGDPVDAFSPSPSANLIRGPQDFGTFEGLEAGTDYYIAVTSGMTCSDVSLPFEIVVPEPIVFVPTPTPTTCNGAADGQITIEVTSGGVGLIQFAIAPNFNEFFSEVTTPGIYTFDELAAGSYEVLIQDENGCFERTTIDVPEPEVVMASLVDVTPETCIGFEDGTAQINVVGGTPFVDTSTFATYYETRIVGPNSDGSEVFVRNDNLYFDNLIGGESYIVFIRDANDCPTDIIIPIEIGVDLTATPDVVYGCEGIFPNSTATVTMLDSSLLPDLLFALDPADPTDAISSNAGIETSWGNLPAGDHIVYIYHQNGCTNSVTFTMEAYEPLTLTAEKTGPNEVTALAEGGYGNYEYFFQGESTGTETVFTTNESGVVNIEVHDEGGCVATIAIPFEFTGMIEIPNFFTPDGDNNNDFWAPNNREFFPNIEVKIYDRYGRVVAILNQVAMWDGKYEGTELPTGDYWYVVNANDKLKTRYVGHFTLYR